MKNVWIPAGWILWLGATAAGAVELTLGQAVELALERNPGLQAVVQLERQVEGGIVEARAGAYPNLKLLTSWSQARSPAFLNSPDFEKILGQFPGASFEPSVQELTRAAVELKQPVWTFGRVGAAIRLAEVAADAAGAQVETARLETALAAAESYLALLSAQASLEAIQGEKNFRLRDLERIRDLLEIGEATELERLRAEAALAELDPEIARRQGIVRVAETRLRLVLDLWTEEPLLLVDQDEGWEAVPDESSAVSQALSRRPELVDLARQEEVFRLRQRIVRSEGLPQIELRASYGREVRELENLDRSLYAAWSASLALEWSFFDGGRRKGQIAQFEAQREQLEWRRRELESRIRLEVEQALAELQAAQSRALAAALSERAATEAERVARASFEEGVARQSDLLDAQSRATSARVLAITTRYEALIQKARLSRVLGELPAGAALRPGAREENTSS